MRLRSRPAPKLRGDDGGVDAAASTATVRRGGMRVDEALKVLNLEKELLAKPASEASGEPRTGE